MSTGWKWRARWLGALGVVLGLAGWAWVRWGRVGVLEARGGVYFPVAVELQVPSFAQADARWGQDRMGGGATLGAEGCAVTSAAMALAYHGMDVDPKRLNAFLNAFQGYTEKGWLYWEAAAEFEPGKVRHAYEDLPSYRLMDLNLLRGNPVIVRVRPGGRGTHFVLVVGKRGYEYLAQDPGAGGRKVELSAFGSRVEALRFYECIRGPFLGW
ncbi:MAG: hypothetical protein RLZZ244_1113 [Verrucomicrobiota bacterium]